MPRFKNEQEAIRVHQLYNIDTDEEGKYNKFHYGFKRAQFVLDSVPKGSDILEIGCNSGGLCKLLMVRNGCFAKGIDVCPDVVERAKKKGVYSRVASAEHLPFKDNIFDAVICSEVLEHLYDPNIGIKEACRVSKKWFIGTVPHPKGHNAKKGIDNHAWHAHIFTKSKLKKLLSNHCKNIQLVNIYYYPKTVSKLPQWIGFIGEVK